MNPGAHADEVDQSRPPAPRLRDHARHVVLPANADATDGLLAGTAGPSGALLAFEMIRDAAADAYERGVDTILMYPFIQLGLAVAIGFVLSWGVIGLRRLLAKTTLPIEGPKS